MADIADVPLWFNILVYMEMYQWYLLAAILPTIYFVIVKLFGFPLLQRWSQEIVIVLHPKKAKFGKITSQYEPFFTYKSGLYWLANPLQNVEDNPNQIHVYTHAINQSVYAMNRRGTKVDEILNSDHKLKSIPSHGIWIMRNFKMHFHRHWQLIIDPTGQFYKLLPVEDRQQFNVGLYHTLGIIKQVEMQEQKEMELGAGEKKVRLVAVNNQVVVQALKYVQEYHNYSANYAYRLVKHLKNIESNYIYWVTGSINPILIVVLGGAAAAVAMVVFMMHGGSPSGLGPMPK